MMKHSTAVTIAWLFALAFGLMFAAIVAKDIPWLNVAALLATFGSASAAVVGILATITE